MHVLPAGAGLYSYVEQYRQAQCAPGFTGVLCGKCEDGWGSKGGLAPVRRPVRPVL